MSIRALQDYTYYSKYARYNKEAKRRETWHEAVDRVKEMHLKKYPQISEHIEWAFDLVKQKRVLGSQRALQFGGAPIEKKNARLYNCCSAYCDRVRFFQECLWLLLCGCGTGFSVQKHHVAKLPDFYENLEKRTERIFVIPDTIEGWADALGILLATYMPHPDFLEWNGNIVAYDYSEIRPAGSYLASGAGKAPGPEPLRLALERIRGLLDRCVLTQKRLRPIDAYDIVMHSSDAVLSGGVRRSATICIFSLDDQEMMEAKTGNWLHENPQRGRSNNSALLIRNKISKEQFLNIIKSVKEYGEPGFIFSEDSEGLFNPCGEISLYSYDEDGNSGWAFCNLSEINGKKIKCVEDFALAARAAAIIGTIQAGYTDFSYLGPVTKRIVEKESLIGVGITGMMDNPDIIFDPKIQRKMARLVVRTNEKFAGLIGINPAARCTCVKPSGCRPINALTTTANGILTLGEIMENHDIRNEWCNFDGDITTHGGAITNTFINGVKEVVKVNLKYGIEMICTPNHPWFVKYRIDRKKQFKKVDVNDWVQAQDLQFGDVLDIDLCAYRNKKHSLLEQEYRLKAYDKHLYNCNDIKQPEKLNNDLSWLLGYLWGDGCMKFSQYRLNFTDEYIEHLEKAQKIIKEQFGISSKLNKYKNNAYDLELGNKFLWYWLLKNGIYKYEENNISQIPRIIRESSYDDILAFIAGMIDSDGHVRYQIVKGGEKRYAIVFSTANDNFANHFQQVAISVGLGFSKSLNCEGENLQNKKHIWLLNLSAHVDRDSFNIFAKNSEKISKLPPGYLWKHEVASPNRGIFGKVHSVEPFGSQPTFDVETEQHWFYAGAIRSHNTTSCLLGSSSGIHPHHAKRYFRRAQANQLEPVLNHYKQFNSIAVEKSVWGANGTDEIITFAIEVDGKTKNDLSALQLLEYVRTTQQNWIAFGKVKERCVKEWLSHNVSNTINVRENEWDGVANYIYDNRRYFAGVSLLPESGDLDYPQAPMVNILTPREILAKYGDGALLASGLIVDALHAFGDLWVACDAALGLGSPLTEPIQPNGNSTLEDHRQWKENHDAWSAKTDWVRRIKQFAKRYCDDDLRKCIYLAKHVHLYKMWLDIRRECVDVDYTKLYEDEDVTKPLDLIACAGGACSI